MSTSATRQKNSKLKYTLVAALSLAAASVFAQEARDPLIGLYVGATAGIGAAQWHCGSSCDRAAFSGKAYGGYHVMPGLSTEINYMYFGGLDRANDAAQTTATGIASQHQSARVVTAGVRWEIELVHDFGNNLRIGWADTHRSLKTQLASGAIQGTNKYSTSLYLGAGFSYRLTERVLLASDIDYIVDGHNSLYLFSVGASTAF